MLFIDIIQRVLDFGVKMTRVQVLTLTMILAKSQKKKKITLCLSFSICKIGISLYWPKTGLNKI